MKNHGTAYCYDAGCRRPECRAAKMAKRREHRARARATNSPAYQRELATSRALKDSYRGTCENCGGPTSGADGKGTAARLCWHCAPAARARRTPEAIIAAIQAWAERFGVPPTSQQWNPAQARAYLATHPHSAIAQRNAELAQLVINEDWPRTSTVIWRLGSWKAAIRAAGFETTKPGPKTAMAA